jgi:SAM-dependent methyltransferase
MSASKHSRPYAIHSAAECDRLERQAALAGLPDHLRFVPIPSQARILDAGCGTGSMARLLAATHRDAQVVGIDVRADYIAYAAERGNKEDLRNIAFRQGDVFSLPFADSTFDVVWSKYVLQWLKESHRAIAEFRRVTRRGGVVVCANFDGFAMTHWPEDPTLQPQLKEVVPQLVDPFIGRKMAPMLGFAGRSRFRKLSCRATTPLLQKREMLLRGNVCSLVGSPPALLALSYLWACPVCATLSGWLKSIEAIAP